MQRPRLALGALTLVLVAACRFEPTGAERWDPPAAYREWFAKTEACSGVRGDFDRIEWHIVPGRSFDCPGGECAGHWSDDHSIYIASDWANHEMVVRHEILHDLLGRTGHPDPPFGQGCPLTWTTWPVNGDGLVQTDTLPADLKHID